MNNITHTQEQMIEFYKNVPSDIRELLLDDNFGPAIQLIGRENGLTPIQSLDTEDVVTLVLLGVEPLKQFSSLLQKKLEIPREKIHKITKGIDEEIFSPVKKTLEKLQATEEKTQGEIKIPLKQDRLSLEKTMPENNIISVKTTPTLSVPIPKPVLPSEQLIPIKSVVGAENMGVGIPVKEEHVFEKKLREVTQSSKTESLTSTENNTVRKNILSTDIKKFTTPETPNLQEVHSSQAKIDPYREIMEK